MATRPPDPPARTGNAAVAGIAIAALALAAGCGLVAAAPGVVGITTSDKLQRRRPASP